MSEPYGSGGGYEAGGGGYGGQQPGYGQPPGPPAGQPQYGGQYPPQTGPASGGFPAAGGFPGQGGPGPGTPMPTPSAPRAPQDRIALTGTILTFVGYFCAGAGVLLFILLLTIDSFGGGTGKFASALSALVTGVGFGGLNFAAGTWLSSLAGKLPGGGAGGFGR
jgi:hypothetical protein